MNKNSTNKGIIIILALLLLGTIGYLFMTNNKLKESNTFLEEQKTEIQTDLNGMIAKYDEEIIKNTSLSDELKFERDEIVLFRDSIKNLKQTNWSLIRRYKNKIKELENSYQELFILSENLKVDNQNLTQKIDSVQVFSKGQKVILDSISVQNTGLTEKVAIASILQVNSIKAISMRKRNNGNLVETIRASKTDALRISFIIAENLLAEAGDENVVIQVLNPDGEVVKSIGSTTLTDNVTVIDYTEETTVDYIKENLDVILIVDTDRKQMKKGIQTVNVYLAGRWVGASKVTLR
jgi:hypothetical protein